MAEILLEPSSLSKIIPLSFDLNDTNASNAAQLMTERQFNTADTDAWFQVTLDGFFGTAGSFDITLFNLNDKSVFNHTGKPFTTSPFYYKLDSGSDETTNEIRHAGRWIGQIVVTLANGNSATRKFIFDIEGHILDGADVQTILLEDYNALIALINTSKDLLTQYNVDYAALLVDLAAAETARTNTYNQLVADQQANIDAFDVALDTGIVAANLATKLQTFEATNNSRLLSAEQQLAEIIQVDLANFGAKGDGATDDSLAFETALIYAIDNNLELIVPKGNYIIGQNVAITNKTNCNKLKITGMPGSKLTITGGKNCSSLWIEFSQSKLKQDRIADVEISGLEIDGSLNGEWPGAVSNEVNLRPIYVEGANSVYIHDNHIHDVFNHTGIQVKNSNFVTIQRNKLINSYGCGHDSFGDGIHVGSDTEKLKVENNIVWNDIEFTPSTHNMGRVGIVSEFQTGVCEISSNIVNGYDRGIHVELTYAKGYQKVDGNTVTACNTSIMIWNTLSPIEVTNNEVSNKGAFISRSLYSLRADGGIMFYNPQRSPHTLVSGNFVTGVDDVNVHPIRTIYAQGTTNGIAPDGTTKSFTPGNFEVTNNEFIDNTKSSILLLLPGSGSRYSKNKFKSNRLRLLDTINVIFEDNDVDFNEFVILAENNDTYPDVLDTTYRAGAFDKYKALIRRNKFYSSTIDNVANKPSIRLNLLRGDILDNYIESNDDHVISNSGAKDSQTYGEVSGNILYVKNTGRELFSNGYAGYSSKRPNIKVSMDLSKVERVGSAPTNGVGTSLIAQRTSVPTSGDWLKNDRIINSNPTVGQPKSWICTVSGTPGTWVSEGTL